LLCIEINQKQGSHKNYNMLIIIGHVSYDEIINASGEQSIIPSGAGYTGALGASMIQKDVGLVSHVGADYDMSYLVKLGIDHTGVNHRADGRTTRFYLNYHYDDPLQRDFKAEFNVGTDINPTDIPTHFVESATHVHLATMPPEQQAPFIHFFRAHNPSIRISVDTIEQFIHQNYEQVVRNFSQCDTIFVDRREIVMLPTSLIQDREVILKLGGEGALYMNGTQTIQVPTRRIENVIDKTSSGDILAGVFLASRAQGIDPESSLQMGCEIATRSIEAFGVDHLLKETYRPWQERV